MKANCKCEKVKAREEGIPLIVIEGLKNWECVHTSQGFSVRPLLELFHMFKAILDKSKKVRKRERGRYLEQCMHPLTTHTKHH